MGNVEHGFITTLLIAEEAETKQRRRGKKKTKILPGNDGAQTNAKRFVRKKLEKPKIFKSRLGDILEEMARLDSARLLVLRRC